MLTKNKPMEKIYGYIHAMYQIAFSPYLLYQNHPNVLSLFHLSRTLSIHHDQSDHSPPSQSSRLKGPITPRWVMITTPIETLIPCPSYSYKCRIHDYAYLWHAFTYLSGSLSPIWINFNAILDELSYAQKNWE